MQLVDNQLVITNKKPLDNPKYICDDSRVLLTDPEYIDKDHDKKQNKLCDKEERKGYVDEEELKNQIKTDQFKLKESDASCSLDEIQGFVYGAVNSRFWMLRKHMNSMQNDE